MVSGYDKTPPEQPPESGLPWLGIGAVLVLIAFAFGISMI
jgi:hypothetical protein